MKIETNNIYLGDSYKLIKEIPSGSVDLIYTDIPYDFTNGGKGGGFLKNEARRKTYKEEIGKFDNGIKWEILDEFVRVLKHIYIYMVFKGTNTLLAKLFYRKRVLIRNTCLV